MFRTFQWIGLAALGLVLTGCVSQDQYSALKLERDRIAEQLVGAQRDASASKSAADAYKSQLDAYGASGATKDGLFANINAENATLRQQLDDINRRYTELAGRPQGGGAALPAPLSDALTQFAQQNPDLVDFDSARGIVKFKSDVVFGVGDANLNANAKSVIDRFAAILNSSAASGYELMVAGHTDNQPVHNPATIAAGNKNNWYLSAHRAISVGEELVRNGVNAGRLGVVGYADQRPIASNTSAGGQQQNRRVEVLILPTTVRGATLANHPIAPKAKGSPKVLNKDSATISREPILNK